MSLFGIAVTAVIVWVVGSLAKAVMATDHSNDPVYKKNLQRLIERNRQFEEAREARNARQSGADDGHRQPPTSGS